MGSGNDFKSFSCLAEDERKEINFYALNLNICKFITIRNRHLLLLVQVKRLNISNSSTFKKEIYDYYKFKKDY
jgi:hypothetical protein